MSARFIILSMAEDQQKLPVNSPSSGEDEAYKEAARSTADYADYRPSQKAHSKIWRKLGKWLPMVLAMIVLIAGAYWLVSSHKSNKGSSKSSSSTTTAKINTATKHYDSTNFNLGFDYPADWTVTDSGKGVLTVRSLSIGLKSTNGQNTTAQITMTIRQNTQKLPEFDSGNAVAAIDSEKIAYTKPTQSQRANTYLSLLRYANSSAGFDGIYITGDFGYKSAQAIPKVDIQKLDPIISIGFAKCNDVQCSNGTSPLSLSIDNWNEQSFSGPLKKMLESLSII